MPYEITTRDGITIRGIPDDVPPDSLELKQRVQKIRAGNVSPEPGLVDRAMALPGRIKEAITGTERTTEQTQTLPDWATMPELNSFSMASAKTGLGTLLSNPAETVKIIQANFPGVQARQDERGNFLLRSSMDGQEYAIKPGFAVSDIPRALGGIAAFTPAGRASTIVGAGVKSAATQAAIEGTQAATGGEFNPGEVAVAGLLGAGVPAVVQTVKAGVNALRPKPAVMTSGQAEAASTAVTEAAPSVPAMGVDELGKTTRTAALGGFGSKGATKTLAEQAAPDPQLLADAEALGISRHLQPDHVTTSGAFRQLAQLIKSQPGSAAYQAQRQGLEQVADRAQAIIKQAGGTDDVSTLSASLGEGMRDAEKQIKAEAKRLYEEVDAAIKPATPVNAENVVSRIRENAANLGGEANLSAGERALLNQLAPEGGKQPTYGLLDKLRKDIGEAKRGKQNAFATSNTRDLEVLESAMRADQKAAAEAVGMGDKWELAQATSRVYKGIQDDMTALFGKELDKSAAPILRGAVSDLGKGDTAKFSRLMKITPPEMRQEVAASGLASFFQRTARGGEMDFAGYARWFEALKRNSESYDALASNLPPRTVRDLERIANVSRGIAMSKGEFLATGKAVNPKALEAAESMMGRVFDAVKAAGVKGAAAEIAGSASGMPGLATALISATARNKPPIMQAADRLITSPEFVAATRAAGDKGQNAAAKSLARSRSFSGFMAAVKGPREMPQREQWILQSMQGANNQEMPK
jgi:hypothetical protein